MTLRRIILSFVREIADEADRNPAFHRKLEQALNIVRAKDESLSSNRSARSSHDVKRRTNRRPLAVLDPVQLARQGEDILRVALHKLDIEQLRDVVAEYGMDTGKLVIKWRTPDRIIDRIVEVARQRALKGSAFRDSPSEDLQERIVLTGTSEPKDG